MMEQQFNEDYYEEDVAEEEKPEFSDLSDEGKGERVGNEGRERRELELQHNYTCTCTCIIIY